MINLYCRYRTVLLIYFHFIFHVKEINQRDYATTKNVIRARTMKWLPNFIEMVGHVCASIESMSLFGKESRALNICLKIMSLIKSSLWESIQYVINQTSNKKICYYGVVEKYVPTILKNFCHNPVWNTRLGARTHREGVELCN